MFQEWLTICSDYGAKFDLKYNAKKSLFMICRVKGNKDLIFPSFHLSGQVLSVCCKIKYLGHILTDQMSDGNDM